MRSSRGREESSSALLSWMRRERGVSEPLGRDGGEPVVFKRVGGGFGYHAHKAFDRRDKKRSGELRRFQGMTCSPRHGNVHA